MFISGVQILLIKVESRSSVGAGVVTPQTAAQAPTWVSRLGEEAKNLGDEGKTEVSFGTPRCLEFLAKFRGEKASFKEPGCFGPEEMPVNGLLNRPPLDNL